MVFYPISFINSGFHQPFFWSNFQRSGLGSPKRPLSLGTQITSYPTSISFNAHLGPFPRTYNGQKGGKNMVGRCNDNQAQVSGMP